jgi:hypothetical protein
MGSSRLRRAGHVAWMGDNKEMRKVFSLEYLKGRGHLEDLGVDVKIILEWML